MRIFHHAPMLPLFLVVVTGCHPAERRMADAAGSAVPLFGGMGHHHRKITTTSPVSQKYFDQGLTWAFAFNHDEAIRSFEEAARHDPDCAMAWWGVALCNGPHINNPVMDAAHSSAAWAALQRAADRRDHASPVEQDLIDALGKRYAEIAPADRKPLDIAYADAMRSVWTRYPDDADVGTLFAESMMDLRPWDLWQKDGSPQPGTDEVLAALETVLKLNPNHPGANHLYIHATEASPHPERAIASADRLRKMVPISGHLVHMPAHIDIRVGHWKKAVDANLNAIEADRKYRDLSPRQGFYRLYMAHNHHFLSFAAMMEGNRAQALKAARDLIAGIPPDFVRENAAFMDAFMTIVMDVHMRFGDWDALLAEPATPDYLPITTAYHFYFRGVAQSAKGNVEAARREQAEFRKAVERVPEAALIQINPARKVLSIADHVLAGEIAYRERKIDDAVRELTTAVSIEDDLLYMEPPEWMQPVRHTLGAVLVDAGRFADAEKVYRDDLRYWPENGWSLYGLAQCLRATQKSDEAKAILARFNKAWARADIKLTATCLCVEKPRAGAGTR